MLTGELTIKIFLAAIAGIVWLVRLEGKVHAANKANEETQKDVDNLRTYQQVREGKLVEELGHMAKELGAMRVIIARLEERLGLSK
jgi:hypothetical protein